MTTDNSRTAETLFNSRVFDLIAASHGRHAIVIEENGKTFSRPEWDRYLDESRASIELILPDHISEMLENSWEYLESTHSWAALERRDPEEWEYDEVGTSGWIRERTAAWIEVAEKNEVVEWLEDCVWAGEFLTPYALMLDALDATYDHDEIDAQIIDKLSK